MSLSVKQKIQSDLSFLQVAKSQNYSTISSEKIEQIVKNKFEYKNNLTTSEEKELFASLKAQLKELYKFKLPYRVYQVIKRHTGNLFSLHTPLLEALRSSKIPIANKEAKKQDLKEIKQQLVKLSLPYEKELQIIESIRWIHGTNSAILPMLAFTDFTMLCTGELLDRGLSPLCGELTNGGMIAIGTNQTSISVETVRNLARCWDYAANISRSFDPEKFEQAETVLTDCLDSLKTCSPDDDAWDTYVIKLLQLKQWMPDVFEELKKKHALKIEETLHASTKKLFFREALIFEALSCPLEELQKGITDEKARSHLINRFEISYDYKDILSKPDLVHLDPFVELRRARFYDHGFINHRCWEEIMRNVISLRLFPEAYLNAIQTSENPSDVLTVKEMKEKFGDPIDISLLLQKWVKKKLDARIQSKTFSSAKRHKRLKNVFEQECKVRLPDADKQMITKPFPILIGSTKTKCFQLAGHNNEFNIGSAKFGDEVDVLFVPKENILSMTIWLQKHGLQNAINVHSKEAISSLFSLPLYHSESDVVGENPALTVSDYHFIHQQSKNFLHLYQRPYTDGSKREHHGPVHAARATFFSAVILEMYLAQGYSLKTSPKYVPVAGYLHDKARESDFGEDLWDEQSGEFCEVVMQNTFKLDPKEARILGKSIIEKEKDPADTVEQKIIHDADCIEIVRCFLESPDAFEQERLWLFKDKFPKVILDFFVSEAKSFIALTEKPLIKDFLQKSSDPLRGLQQILFFSHAFPFLLAHTMQSWEVLCSSQDYLLTPEIEQAIKEKK